MFQDISQVGESAVLGVENSLVEHLFGPKNWQVLWTVRKFHDCDDEAATIGRTPDEVVSFHQNLLLASGGNELLKLLTGTGGTAYGSGAYLQVGNSATAAASSQTSLQGASTGEVQCSSSYPVISGTSGTWRFAFGSSAAQFSWQEFGLKNAAGVVSSSIIMLNRKVSDLGTKTTGTWTIDVTIVVS